MPGRGLPFAVPLLLIAPLALAAGCGGGAGGEATPGVSPTATTKELKTATPGTATVAATTTAAATSSATPAPDIRRQDLTEQPGLREFLASGGEVDPGEIIYADLTEDGVEEAVVPVSSGGEGGDIAVFVFGYGAGGLQELLRVIPESDALRADLIDGALTITEPVFGPGDPFCCPSQLRTTTYQWDGSNLVVEREELTEP